MRKAMLLQRGTSRLIFNIAFFFISTVALPQLSLEAKDGGALYKSKCAGCHGASGEGKPAMKAPPLKGTALTAEQITSHITKGEATSKPPHNKGIVGVTDAHAKLIAEFIKTMK